MVSFLKNEKGAMRIFPAPHTQNIQELTTLFKELDPFVPGYHIDIMDGEFVPATMGSIQLTNQLDTLTPRVLWVHLMVKNPLAYIKQLRLKSESIISFHYESIQPAEREEIIGLIEQNLWRASLAINPETPIGSVLQLTHGVSHLTLMAVHPGAAGQEFLPETWEKIEHLIAYRAAQEFSFEIAVDGGTTTDILSDLKEYGVNAVATHSALFKNDTPLLNLQKLSELFTLE